MSHRPRPARATTTGTAYASYRDRVPALVPGLRLRPRPAPAAEQETT